MKRGTIEHAKTAKLARCLKAPRYAAVGILESLWHMAATKAPTGDISTIPLDDVAFYVGWEGDPAEVVEALVESRWLDRHGDQLLVHDWAQHAEDSVRKWLSRNNMTFAVPVETCRDKSGHVATNPDKSRHVAPAYPSLPSAEPTPMPVPPPTASAAVAATSTKEATEPETQQQPDKPAKPRPRNPLWDAVVSEFGLIDAGKRTASRIGAVVSELKAKGASPQDVGLRVAAYRQQWPDAECTPEALAKHWERFAVEPEPYTDTPPPGWQEAVTEFRKLPQGERTRLVSEASRLWPAAARASPNRPENYAALRWWKARQTKLQENEP